MTEAQRNASEDGFMTGLEGKSGVASTKLNDGERVAWDGGHQSAQRVALKALARKVAKELGHDLGAFSGKRPGLKMASCLKCYGCCWVSYGDGGRCGGRLLKYACGTPEAAGFLPRNR